MSNFKSGSGDLNFDDSGDDEENSTEEPSESAEEDAAPQQSSSSSRSQSESTSRQNDVSVEEPEPSDEAQINAETEKPDYPYFVRRNNVGDERDVRLEVHARKKVADQEAEFRKELAEYLGVSDVSKTDAREFALLAAYKHPDRVAQLMKDEGFGALD